MFVVTLLACSALLVSAYPREQDEVLEGEEEVEVPQSTPAPEQEAAEASSTTAAPKVTRAPADKPVTAPAPAGGIAPVAITDQALGNAIKDRRYMMHQIKCTLGEGPCDSVGRKLKALAPLVMKNICFQCSPQEKRQIQVVVSHIQRNYPAQWSKIVRQFGST